MKIVGFKPYPKQQEIVHSFINEPYKYYTVCTGRQIGKSLIIENLTYYYLINLNGSFNGIISPTYKQVKKLYKAISNNLKQTPIVKTDNRSDLTIELINGSIIQFFSAENHDSLRGNTFSGVLLLDEFAFYKPNAWTESIKATTLVKCKKVGFFSTPKGKTNEFYSEYLKGLSDEYPKSKSFQFSSFENPYIEKSELEEYKKSLPYEIFKQEILGEFGDEDSDVFRNINELCIHDTEAIHDKPYYIGIDLGNKNDYTVLSAFDNNGKLCQLYRFQKSNWNEIIVELKAILKRYKTKTVYCESNGVGSPIYDALKLEFQHEVKEFITTNDSKQTIIQQLIYAMDEKSIKLLNDDNLKGELKSFTFAYSKNSGRVLYGARSGFHDDIIMSMAIAYNTYLKYKNGRNKIIVL